MNAFVILFYKRCDFLLKPPEYVKKIEEKINENPKW